VIRTGAQLLSQARIQHVRLTELPLTARPRNPEEAYDCQAVLVGQLLGHYGGEVCGYKVACTNPIAQRQLSVDSPFSGHLLSSFCFASPARLKASEFFMRVVEAEFAFQMARDLPPGGAPFSREEIVSAIEGLIPGVEIVDSRFESWTTIGAPSLIADNACNAAWVRGTLRKEWQNLDLAAQPVRVMVNGRLVREGSGSAVLGHPLNALEWLVNNLASRGIALKAGQYVTTGITTEVYMAEPGDRIIADFGEVGTAEVEFE
jgi:2-keto-4-pentenoate hydratase